MNTADIEQQNEQKANNASAFFSYYREKRPEKFSDTVVKYEIPLTKELFEQQMDLLSTKKMQSAFENFVVAVAKRVITPNIKPQTGPDGGGDGKVDAETYRVSNDISDKWYSTEDTASGSELWAFAISCKKQWKTKVESDVEKIAGTGRGYTRALFFSNQFIKSSTRADVEKSLSGQYGIKVEIYDRLYLENVVFQDKCIDLALEHLGFSDAYKKKTVVVGPNDKARQARLEEIEKSILRQIDGFDTGYVDELHEACILSRGLELPRTEVEGRFHRAMRECEHHGSKQQMFLLIYDHAWTSFFWYEDIDATYNDFQKLKTFIDADCSVYRIERITNILTNLINVAKADLYPAEKVKPELEYIKSILSRLESKDSKPSCVLFLRIYLCVQRLITHIQQDASIIDDLNSLRPLLLKSASHLEISFESNYQIMEVLSGVIDESPEFDELVDEMADILADKRMRVEAADLRCSRALSHISKQNWTSAIRQLGFCVYAYEQEEHLEDLIKSSGYMGIALSHLNLPYSAEAYLLKSVSFLLKNFYATGVVPHLLVTVSHKLCEIELRLGRLVMYWNWYELLNVIATNGQYREEKSFIESCQIDDAAWACRFSLEDLRKPFIAQLPDIFERLGMFTSSEYLKYMLGYPEDVDESCLPSIKKIAESSKMKAQPLIGQLLDKVNISTNGDAYQRTTVRNYTITMNYENDCETQQLVEIFLASIESFFATFENFEVLAFDSKINIQLVHTSEPSCVKPMDSNSDYIFNVNKTDFTDEKCWECIAMLISCLLTRNSVTTESIETILETRQNGERLMDRVSVLQHTKLAMTNVLGNSFKYKLENWTRDTDKLYPYKGDCTDFSEFDFSNNLQSDTTIIKINEDMSLWEGADWKGCGFIHDQWGQTPPIFGLAFGNLTRGEIITSEWKPNEREDKQLIRIYLIKGIDANNPTYYRVCIAPAFPHDEDSNQRFVATMCRKHTMTPATNENLARFEKQYKRFGGCWLMAFQITDKNEIVMPRSFEGAFKFTEVVFKEAYTIGLMDEARMAIEPDDNPFIPESHKDTAPILDVLKEMEKLK